MFSLNIINSQRLIRISKNLSKENGLQSYNEYNSLAIQQDFLHSPLCSHRIRSTEIQEHPSSKHKRTRKKKDLDLSKRRPSKKSNRYRKKSAFKNSRKNSALKYSRKKRNETNSY